MSDHDYCLLYEGNGKNNLQTQDNLNNFLKDDRMKGLHCRYNDNIKYIGLSSMDFLNCVGCNNIKYIGVMEKITYIYCDKCPNLKYVENLPNLENLILYNCENLIEIRNIPEKLKVFKIVNCPNVKFSRTL